MKRFQRCIFVVPLVILAGCPASTDPPAPSSPAPSLPEPSIESDNERLRVEDDWLIAEQIDRHDVDQIATQLNDQKLEKLRITYPLPSRDEQAHRAILKQIGQSCPQLVVLELSGFNIELTPLQAALLDLTNLNELRLKQCTFETTSDNLKARPASLDKLDLLFCNELDDERIAELLGVCPNLQDLTVATSWTRDRRLTGQGWPLNDMHHLQSFQARGASDELIRYVVGKCSALTSLNVNQNTALTGEGWNLRNGKNFEALHLSHCNEFTEDNVQKLLQQTPYLKSLSLTGYGNITGGSIDPKSLSSLTSLRLAGRKLDYDFVAQTVEHATGLEELKIRGIYPGKDRRLTFEHLTQLRDLSVNGSSVQMDFPATLPPTIEHLHIGHCSVTNASIATMLPRLSKLQTLDLYWLSGPSGRESDPQAVTGSGWDFSKLTNLRELDLSKSRYLNNDLISQLAQQLPELKSLQLCENQRLTGDHWDLSGFHQLEELSLKELERLKDGAINELPPSLKRLHIERCSQLEGSSWQLEKLSKLESLRIRYCDELVSLGRDLPESLREASVAECSKLRCSDLNYHSMPQCRTLTFRDCRSFDVNHLFLHIASSCRQLQSLNLSGCPDVTVSGWDLSTLKESLDSFQYFEGDPSYFGGASEATARNLTQQLSDRFECDHTR